MAHAPPSTGREPTFLGRLVARWSAIPLYQRIVGAVLLGLAIGWALGPDAKFLEIPGLVVLRMLGALAPPLILLAVIQALLAANIHGRLGLKLVALLAINTLVAIVIGLAVANLVKPGRQARVEPAKPAAQDKKAADPLQQLLEGIPKSVLGPLGDNGQVMGVIFLALAFGIALRRVQRDVPIDSVKDAVDIGMRTMIVVLHWIIAIVPLAVLGVVASIVGVKGFGTLRAFGMFVVAVVLALALQSIYYMLRVRFGSWVRPRRLLAGSRDALVMAFSTASSTATMPVTYACLKDRVGLREQSASLGALVGANFNNDGTALYEAMAALFVAQLLGLELTLGQQIVLVLTSVVASVGAAGIPEAGLVTMTLVFTAVFPKHIAPQALEYIPALLTVDWFLDRCRTTINVMGDLTVSCLLDGKNPPPPLETKPAA